MRSRILQLFLVPVLAGAMLLTGTVTAQAAPAMQASAEAAALEAKAIRTAQAVEKSLRATGSAVFTGADGTVHRMSLSGSTVVVDGQATTLPPSAALADWWCNIKVGAAIAAIATVGAIAIWAFIAGLPAATVVSIAGYSFTAGTWSTIASIMASGGSLVAILQVLLC